MADNAIGLIETKGYMAALAVGDAMIKAVDVRRAQQGIAGALAGISGREH